MTKESIRPVSNEGRKSVKPYPPSWVDRLLGAVAKLPGPTWLGYLGSLVIALLLSHAVRWIEGSLTVGSVEILEVAGVSLMVLFPAIQHYLNTAAGIALDGFRPALQVSDEEYGVLHYQLTTVPWRSGGFAGAIGAAVGLSSLLSNPLGFGFTSRTSLVTIILSGFSAMLTTAS